MSDVHPTRALHERRGNPFSDRRPSAGLRASPSRAESGADGSLSPAPAPTPDHDEVDPACEPSSRTTRAAIQLGPELRTMTGYEEELVEDPELRGNTAALCNELLARCLVEPGADPSPARARVGALTSAERDLALVALRHKSFGGIVELVADCPSCGEGCGLSFDLGALPVELGDIVEELEVELPDGRARLRLPTAAEQAELVGLEIESAARRRTWLLAHVLITVAGRGGPFVEDDVHALPSASRRALERELSAALPEYDLAMDIDCQECGYQFESPFDIESFFLLS